MQTPAGKECRHYYEDFHRGRNIQECRLMRLSKDSLPWRPVDCSRCPVPDILNANASPLLRLEIAARKRFMGFGRYVEVKAFCENEEIPLEEAYTGCDSSKGTRPGLDLFRRALNQDDEPE